MIPSWLQVMLLSLTPITEYQLAIPLAIAKYHFAPEVAYFLCVTGSFIPFFPLYFGFMRMRNYVARLFPKLVKPFDALIARAERKTRGDYEKYGAVALFLALVVPLPLTGVWTMTLAAVALKIPLKNAALGIGLGMMCGAGVVTLVSLGVLRLPLF